MGLANRITFFRIALAPVFAGLFAAWSGGRDPVWLLPLWAVFLVSEFSDIADGWVARKRGETSDLGKVLDPFSDVLSRLTIFVCLLTVGLAPLWFVLIVLYREVSMTFLRMLIVQQGVVQGASTGGKIKAWLYFFASVAGLLRVTFPDALDAGLWFWGLNLLFAAAAAQSVFSFVQYLAAYLRREKSR